MNGLLLLIVVPVFCGTIFSAESERRPELFCVSLSDSKGQPIEFTFEPTLWRKVEKVLKKANARVSFIHSDSLRTKNLITIERVRSVFAGIPEESMKELSLKLEKVTNKRS